MTRKPRSFAPLPVTLAALGLGAFIYFYETKKPTTDEATAQKSRLLPGLKADSIKSLAFKPADEKPGYTLVPRPEKSAARKKAALFTDESEIDWDLSAPIAARADRARAGGLIDRLVNLDKLRQVQPEKPDLAQYGLVGPADTITLQLGPEAAAQGLPATVEWTLGGTTPFPGERYLKDQTGAIFVVADGLAAAFNLEAFALRDKRLLGFDSVDINSLRIEPAAGAAIRLEKGKLRWEFSAPQADWADDADVEAFMGGLQFLSAAEFAPAPAGDLSAYGLGKPAAKITLIEKADGKKAGAEHWIEIGSAAPPPADQEMNKKFIYVRSSLSAAVAVIEASWLEKALAAEPIKRDATLLPAAVAWSKVQFAAGPLFRAKGKPEENSWRAEPFPAKGMEVDGAILSAKMSALAQLRAVDFGGQIAGHEKEFGLDKPHRSLKLTSGDKVEIELRVGGPSPKGRWLQRVGRPAALQIDAAAAESIPADGAIFLRAAPASAPAK